MRAGDMAPEKGAIRAIQVQGVAGLTERENREKREKRQERKWGTEKERNDRHVRRMMADGFPAHMVPATSSFREQNTLHRHK